MDHIDGKQIIQLFLILLKNPDFLKAPNDDLADRQDVSEFSVDFAGDISFAVDRV